MKILCRLHFRFWTYGPPDFGPNGPKWPKNLFFEMWLVCIVIIYEIEAFFMEITKKIFLELFDHFWPLKMAHNGPKTYFLRCDWYVLLLYMKLKLSSWRLRKKYFWNFLTIFDPPKMAQNGPKIYFILITSFLSLYIFFVFYLFLGSIILFLCEFYF